MKYITTSFLPTVTLALCGVLFLSTTQAEDKAIPITSAESKFIQTAAIDSHAETEIAQLAVKKSENANVKAFAATLVTDHKTLNKELKQLAATPHVMLSKEITPAQTATLKKLETATGLEFDKEFLATVTDHHQSHISSYEQASKDHKDKELKLVVDKTIPVLKAHHATAVSLATK